MTRTRWTVSLAAAAMLLFSAGAAESQRDGKPATIEDCYLDVAMQKQTADMVYLARELCDAAFGRVPRVLAVLEPKTQICEEWWFDANGRNENADRYCSLEPRGDGRWNFACQWKKTQRVTLARLRENGGRYEVEGAVQGVEVGTFFRSLAPCVESKLAKKR